MGAFYTLDHAGLRCTLRAGPAGPVIAVWLCLLASPVGFASALLGPAKALLWFVGIYGGLVLAALGLWASARIDLRCDGRIIAWRKCWGPLQGAVYRVSLLDLHAVGADRGRLLLEPRPGPLLPVALGGPNNEPEVVAQIARHLHEAIDQAERFRGDAPDERTRTVAALASQKVHQG